MAVLQSSTDLTRQLEIFNTNFRNGTYDLQDLYANAIARFTGSVLPVTDPVLVTLSSTLVALNFPDGPNNSYGLRLQGSGIGPVSTLNALASAIENGIATGALNRITLTNNAVTILTLDFAPTQYTLTTGADQFRLTGALPTTFEQIFDLANLLDQLNTEDIVAMSPATRSSYFNALSAYGVTGFAVGTSGTDILSFAITATGAVLRIADLTLTLNGQLPNNFGAIANLLYSAYIQFEALGEPVDLTQLPGLSVTSLVMTGAGGIELARLTGPFTTEAGITRHTITGTSGDDVVNLLDLPFADVPVLVANLGAGNDHVTLDLTEVYLAGAFALPGTGTPSDITVNGGAGTDRLVVQNYVYESGVVIDLAAGRLQGVTLGTTPDPVVYTVAISSFEDVVLEGHGHRVLGSAGNDMVRLSENYWQNLAGLLFAGGAGVDTLDLSGLTSGETGFINFPGLTRATLTSSYRIERDSTGTTGNVVFDNLSTDIRLPDLRLLDVENLILRTATGTETVSVASLINTVFQVSSPVFYGTYLNDRITGTSGNDTIHGMDGTDTIIGGAGDDFLFGGASEADLRDMIFGGDGNDYIDGGWGNDELRGDAGNDTIDGGFGADTIIGGEGNDLLSGGAGSDAIFGGPGNDTINGGFGFDRLNGGTGADRFFHLGVASHGSDWVQDYNAAEGDRLVFGQAGATRAQFQVNAGNTPNAGSAAIAEAFVIYRPTGQIIWALVDGMGQAQINLQLGGEVFDLLA
jgi:Ca2+-binding RTX toxin-like protein